MSVKVDERKRHERMYGGDDVYVLGSGKQYLNIGTCELFVLKQDLTACSARRYGSGYFMARRVASGYGYGFELGFGIAGIGIKSCCPFCAYA